MGVNIQRLNKEWVPYSEKLKDPRWKEKRLRIIERDGNKCQHCGKKGHKGCILHVHHFKYYRQPWDVKDESLITLCKNCHEREEVIRSNWPEIKRLSSETLVLCIVWKDILDDVQRLKKHQLASFKELLSSFLHPEEKPIKFKVIGGGIGGRAITKITATI